MSNREQLKPFDYLIGGTWTARGELPGLGSYVAERTYHWTLDGHFIEQHQVMVSAAGRMETKGLIGWDAGQAAVMAWGFGSDGGVAATRSDRATAEEIRFEGVRTGGFNAGPVRATYRRAGENEFVEIAESKQGETWMPMFTFQFTREPAASEAEA